MATTDAVTTMKHLFDKVGGDGVRAIILAGDLSYADGYAPAWDTYGHLAQSLHEIVPTAYASGNHEVANGMENFVNFVPRYGWPAAHVSHDGRSSASPYWFSFEVGLAHVITLCSYCDHSNTSLQYSWLQDDLANVDRKRTPWLIV